MERTLHYDLSLVTGLGYCYDNGPLLDCLESIFESGINCQLLVHIVLEEVFGIGLDKDMMSSELFADQQTVKHIRTDQTQPGDICFFGPIDLCPEPDPENKAARKLHLGVVISGEPEPMVIHAAVGRGVVIEPVTQIQQAKRYAQLWAVKRPKV